MCQQAHLDWESIKRPITVKGPNIQSELSFFVLADTLIPGTVISYDDSSKVLQHIAPTQRHSIPQRVHAETAYTKYKHNISTKLISFRLNGKLYELEYLPSSEFYGIQPNDCLLVAKYQNGAEILRNITEETYMNGFFANEIYPTNHPSKTNGGHIKFPREEMLVQNADIVHIQKHKFKLVRIIGSTFGQATLTLFPQNKFYNVNRFDRLLMGKNSNPNVLRILENVTQQTK